jgi:hypothetical protein
MKVRFLAAMVAAGAAAFIAAGSAGAAADSTCPGGILASGIYNNVSVTGTCTATGEIWIKGNLNVSGNSVFDAEHGGTINGNVQAWPGSVLILVGLGVTHGVSASGAKAVVLLGDGLGQGALIQGGGGPASGACQRRDVPVIIVPAVLIESTTVIGNVTIAGRGGCLNALLGNEIGGSVQFVNNTADNVPGVLTGGNFVASNLILGNLFCMNNSPHPSLDGGGLNSVGGTVKFPGDCFGLA